MIKHFGMQKCNVLAGDVVNLTKKKAQELGLYLESLDKDLEKEIANIEARRIELESYLKKDIDPKDGTKMKSRQRCSLRKKIKRAYARPDYLHKMFNNRRQRVRSELRTWQNKPGRFTFVLEPLTEE